MRTLKKTNLKAIREHWTICMHCASCYYHGPFIPFNWLELPPPEWSVPAYKCPSYDYYKFKAYTAVGRGDLAAIVFDDKKFPVSDDLIEIAYTCTSCGMCSEICAIFKPMTAIWALREELVDRGVTLPEPLRKIESNIQNSNNIFGAKISRDALKGIPAAGPDIYFAGCVARFQKPEVTKAAIGVLKAAGINIAYMGETEKCCGFVPGHDGNTELLEDQAARVMNDLKKAGAKRIIVSCAHCYKTLKTDYPLIFGELPFEVVHFAEIISKLIEQKKVRFNTEIRKKLTYHDPCFLGRHSKVYDEPRKVLKSIPGIELVEMERSGRWSYCCGSGAKITSNCYPEFVAANSRERLMECQKAADTVVTACTTCFSHMDKHIEKEEIGIQVYDLPVLVAEAMGIK